MSNFPFSPAISVNSPTLVSVDKGGTGNNTTFPAKSVIFYDAGTPSLSGNAVFNWDNTNKTLNIGQPNSSGVIVLIGNMYASGNVVFGNKVFINQDGVFYNPSNKNTIVPNLIVSGLGVNQGYMGVRHTSPGAGGPQFILSSTRSSNPAGYTIVQANDGLGTINFQGSDGNEFVPAAQITARVDATPGDNSMPGKLEFLITADGASTPAVAMYIANNSAVVVGSPTGSTGGGAGSLNAQAVYDDGALLSCYVFEAFLDGKIDIEKWDKNVPNRKYPELRSTKPVDKGKRDSNGEIIFEEEGKVVREAYEEVRYHAPARNFADSIGSENDSLDIDKFSQFWQKNRHLPAMPNKEEYSIENRPCMGDWVQRLVETIEVQAVHIHLLNERLKVLEAK